MVQTQTIENAAQKRSDGGRRGWQRPYCLSSPFVIPSAAPFQDQDRPKYRPRVSSFTSWLLHCERSGHFFNAPDEMRMSRWPSHSAEALNRTRVKMRRKGSGGGWFLSPVTILLSMLKVHEKYIDDFKMILDCEAALPVRWFSNQARTWNRGGMKCSAKYILFSKCF